jgi:hypothetical protein
MVGGEFISGNYPVHGEKAEPIPQFLFPSDYCASPLLTYSLQNRPLHLKSQWESVWTGQFSQAMVYSNTQTYTWMTKIKAFTAQK